MQRIISAFASEAETASIFCPVPITVAGPRPAISFSTSSARITSCCRYPPSAQPTESSKKRLAWYTASPERCLYSSPAAQRDMVAVMVPLALPCIPVDTRFLLTSLRLNCLSTSTSQLICHPERSEGPAFFSSARKAGSSLRSGRQLLSAPFPQLFHLHVLRILKRQKRHEIGVMHNERFGRALHQIAFGCVRGDDVAHGIRYAALHRQRNSGKRMPQRFSALALPALAVRADFIFQQLADIRQNRAGNHHVGFDRQRSTHKVGHRLRAVACNVHHATLVLHERDRTIRNQQGKRNLIQVLGLQRTSLQRLDPGLRYLLPKLGILDQLNFRPQSFDGLPHGQGLLTELTRLSESMRMRRADAPRLCDLKCDWQSMKIRNEDYFSIGSSSILHPELPQLTTPRRTIFTDDTSGNLTGKSFSRSCSVAERRLSSPSTNSARSGRGELSKTRLNRAETGLLLITIAASFTVRASTSSAGACPASFSAAAGSPASFASRARESPTSLPPAATAKANM